MEHGAEGEQLKARFCQELLTRLKFVLTASMIEQGDTQDIVQLFEFIRKCE